ncbi:MAG TPA: histidine kinase dimerization/phosphoacceptor domain -containing protein [Leptospiraceae bacterium]|nr:histidine kinase dimerization/phosphoacceptor domain -containing protein [Leptospiraceae bacterium]
MSNNNEIYFENKSYYESRYNPILNEKNEVIGITAFASDITERIQREETIQKQLAEKEILLKEVYHRIKNSIISIESLLLLQGESSLNVDVKTALKESVLRIQSIRVLYEKLLLSNHYQNVSIKNYIDSLIDSLIAVFPESKKVFIERQIMDFRITTKKAIPLGIIINELITNIFKHAFNEKTTGHILIELYKSENQGILTIQDNGVGMEESFPTSKSSGYGLSIVKMLVQQILGTYTVENMNGTKSIIQFEIEF